MHRIPFGRNLYPLKNNTPSTYYFLTTYVEVRFNTLRPVK